MGPKGVAVDKNGHIITADNKACCVFIFQSNGKLVTKFGAKGTSERQFAGNISYFSSAFNSWPDHVLIRCYSLFLGRQKYSKYVDRAKAE